LSQIKAADERSALNQSYAASGAWQRPSQCRRNGARRIRRRRRPDSD